MTQRAMASTGRIVCGAVNLRFMRDHAFELTPRVKTMTFSRPSILRLVQNDEAWFNGAPRMYASGAISMTFRSIALDFLRRKHVLQGVVQGASRA